MRTFMTAAFAAILALGLGFSAQASRVVTNTTDQLFNAADELSTEMLVVKRGTSVKIFVNGTYDVTAILKLQRERGSPGSGAWEDIQTVTAVPAVADATREVVYITKFARENLRLKLDAISTGAVVAYMTDAPSAPAEYTDKRLYQTLHDDFFNNTATLSVESWVTEEDDSTGTVCVVTVTLQEGAVTCISGTGEDAGDAVGISHIDVTDGGALVSDGTMVVEARVKATDYDGQVGVCLNDEEFIATTIALFDIDTNVIVFDTSNQEDAACIMNQDEADGATLWEPVSAIADAEGNNSDEWDNGPVVVDDTYTVLRIEIDSAGNAYFYVDGLLIFAEPLAVATTARLIPFLWTNTTTDGSGGATTLIIDYITFIRSRPTS